METLDTRNMQQELQDFRKRRAAERAAFEAATSTPTRVKTMRSDENTPTRSAASMRGKVFDDGFSPKTPSHLRRHVNAVSPLMEVCQNTARSAGELRRCRSSPVASPATASSVAGLKMQTQISSSRPMKECILDDSIQAMDSFLREAHHAVSELIAWEEAAQAPSVPPASPATPYQGLASRCEVDHNIAIQGFLHGLPHSLGVAASQEQVAQTAPLRQDLLSRLDESEVDTLTPCPAFQAPFRSPPSSITSPGLLRSPNAEALDGTLPVESPVPLSLEASLLNVEDEQPSMSEADEMVLTIQCHQMMWPQQTLLCMEDYLSRSHDIEMFWFFEVRDLANTKTAKERKFQESLDSIPEYPPNCPLWKIESDRSRSAMRSRRRSPRSNHQDGEVSTGSIPWD